MAQPLLIRVVGHGFTHAPFGTRAVRLRFRFKPLDKKAVR